MKKIIQNITSQPKTKEELRVLIEAEIKKFGVQCDLNHIDISLVTDFSFLFCNSYFNGDISRWDVSSVTHMDSMFFKSKFYGDISKWNVSGVMYMDGMFCGSQFNGNVLGWNVSGVSDMCSMFADSKFNGDISKWDVSKVTNMCSMFANSGFNGDFSNWVRSAIVVDEDIFLDSAVAKKLGIENPNLEQVKSHFLSLKLEDDLLGDSPRQGGLGKVRL